MKRPVFALFASLLLLGLMPGATLAIATPTYLDQSNTGLARNTAGELAQTFTAGQSGQLTRVALSLTSLNNPGGGSLSVAIFPTDGSGTPVTTGTPLATSDSPTVPYNPSTSALITFSFGSPYGVTAGTMYAIVFHSSAGANVWAFGSDTDTYSRGAAWRNDGPSWTTSTSPYDFAFNTYLAESVTTTVVWDKSQVTAGTGTALKLTVTIAFGNGAEAGNYIVLLGDLPSWYVNPTPPTIVCSWDACALTTIQGVSGITVSASNPGATLTVTLQGMATPGAADIGTPGAAHGNGCIVVSETSLCSDGTASVQVVAAPAATPAPTPAPTPTPTPSPTKSPTPPPTSTGVGSAPDNTGGTIWFLPFALFAFFGGLLVLVDRRRRRLF
jgi:hypothetical protein